MTIIRRADTTPTEHALQAPWLESVTVPAGAALLFVSGQIPPVADARYGLEDRRAYGNMETQTLGVLEPVTHRWAATVGYRQAILPVHEEARPGVFALGGYNGTGNVIGSMLGRRAADWAVTRG